MHDVAAFDRRPPDRWPAKKGSAIISVYRHTVLTDFTLVCPGLSVRTPPHSHSMVSEHRNALIFMRKKFLLTVETRPSVRQISSLLISKEKSRDSNFARLRQLSLTIGRFLQVLGNGSTANRAGEKTVTACRPARPLCHGSCRSLVCDRRRHSKHESSTVVLRDAG